MKIIDLAAGNEVSSLPEKAVFLMGCFDGVHRGHRALFREAESAPHSAVCVHTFASLPKTEHHWLTDTAEKLRLFRAYGADYAVLEEFEEVRALDGGAFFRERLERFDPAGLICGFNYRFGRNASGTSDDLAHLAQESGRYIRILPPCTVNGLTVSSTAIREAVETGDLGLAEAMLGRPYSVTSEVLHGCELGRTLGFPTLNQRLPEGKVSPPRGVYTCTVRLHPEKALSAKDAELGGMGCLGSRPTVNADANDVTLETHLFGYSGNLYGATVTTFFREYLRPEVKFGSLSELREQLRADSANARRRLAKLGFKPPSEDSYEA